MSTILTITKSPSQVSSVDVGTTVHIGEGNGLSLCSCEFCLFCSIGKMLCSVQVDFVNLFAVQRRPQ